MCVYVYVYVYACVRACVRARARVFMCVLGDVMHGGGSGRWSGDILGHHICGPHLRDRTWGTHLRTTLCHHTWGPRLGTKFVWDQIFVEPFFWGDQFCRTKFLSYQHFGDQFLGDHT